MKRKFSVPYSKGISEWVCKYKDSISEIYFNDGVLGSARAIKLSEEEMNELRELKAKGFKLNYVFNPQHYSNEIYSNLRLLEKQIENIIDFYAIDFFTMNNAVLMNYTPLRNLLNERNVELKASVNLRIDSLEKVRIFHEDFDIKNIVLDRNLNRNYEELERIKRYGEKFKVNFTLILNEGCLPNCPFKLNCDEIISQINDEDSFLKIKPFIDTFLCTPLFEAFPEKILQSPFISPLGLFYYPENFEYKISGRSKDSDILKSIFLDYLFCRSKTPLRYFFSTYRPEINFTFYELEEFNFSKKVLNCKLNCHSCNFCSDLILNLWRS